ncbi:Aste57867_16920 [Aphanomyces stellatus]|uniref:Aste57867_16920 protein n=1 Tax=Aphanomyces stellatus TaxID=120398 RepID=A0A485L7Q8_9STRA|nr:hypothetical protein As57867_016862 [Aphanomyces stellatus]VFT93682.1 Aste57867_16920 [Aphanomyces stellatus]
MSLGEHQKEMLGLARQQNVLVSGKSGIGKTFAAAFLTREVLLGDATKKVLVVVTGAEKTNDVYQLLTRLCSQKVAASLDGNAHSWHDDGFAKAECQAARIVCVSPAIASNLFYCGFISLETLALIVLEHTEELYKHASVFCQRLVTKYTKLARDDRPRIFGMVSKPLSELDLPSNDNPLYKLLLACCIAQPTFRKRATIAPILVETFQYEPVNYSEVVGYPVEFLRGVNGLRCNVESLYQNLLNLGNLNSQYDVLTVETRRKRFVASAEAVLEQLGLWCFFKFVELEIRHEMDEALRLPITNGMDTTTIQGILSLGQTTDDDTIAADASPPIDQHADIQAAKAFLDWITEQQTRHGLGATNSRLKKVADLFGSFMENTVENKRCWVFLQRRAHSRVVAEYLTACFPAYPPCCSMQGSGQANVVGAEKHARTSDVEEQFNAGATPLLVSTAMSSEVERIAPCGLVISMDEVVDPHKLLDFRQRAHPDHGVFKYIIPDTTIDFDKYKSLFHKMAALLSMDSDTNTRETLDQAVHPRKNKRGYNHHGGRTKYELYHADVKTKMKLENSIQILTAFCHTLPGIKIYDNRPLYLIKRHLMGGAEARKRGKFRANQISTDANESHDSQRRFLYSASLKLPSMLRMKQNINTPKVTSDKQAKCIAAFKAVEELLKRGYLDRRFKSKLLVNRDVIPQDSIDEDMELSTQNSYDIPPVTAVEMGLPPFTSKLTDGDAAHTYLYLYGLDGMNYGILCTEPLFDGRTEDCRRFDLATSDVLEPAVRVVAMSPNPQCIRLDPAEMTKALKFHVVLMRLICTGVDAAMKPTPDVAKEFSTKNDKGYVVVPAGRSSGGVSIDWDAIDHFLSTDLLRPAWPMSDLSGQDEWVFVSNKRRNVAYIVKEVTNIKVGDVATLVAGNENYWSYNIRRAKSAPGRPILGRWYTKENLLEASRDQPFVYGIEIPGTVPLIRFVHERNLQLDYGHLKERLLIPEQTSVLALTKTKYFEALSLLPLIFEFERKCQLSTLMRSIGCDIDTKHLEEATTRPAYERLETLGDCFLKLESTWWLYQNRSDIKAEGTLSMMRGDMIRNDRLCQLSMKKLLHHYMIYPKDFEQQPFRSWIPSCMGRTPDSVIAHLKWIADVLESTCGAWTGCSVCVAPQIYNKVYFPDCLPQPLAPLARPETPRDLATWDLTHLGYDDIPERMYLLQTSLKYNFKDKRLLLEAITHPSVAQWLIHADKTTTNVVWKGDYERLEYLGDALIEYLVVTYAYIQFPTWQPSALSDWKGATVCNDSLGKAALICFHIDQIMLTGSMRMDPHLAEKLADVKRLHADGAPTSDLPHVTMPKIFADGFEALCAAVFIDAGCDLHVIRDVFLGPLLATIGEDAIALVTKRNVPKASDACLPQATNVLDEPSADDVVDGAEEPVVVNALALDEEVAVDAHMEVKAVEIVTSKIEVVESRPDAQSKAPIEIIEIDDSDDE